MRILITGFSGFVARHFVEYLVERNETFQVLGIDISEPRFDLLQFEGNVHIEYKNVNMLNLEELQYSVADFNPEYILHLAAFSSVAYSWEKPSESFLNNSNIFLNLIETVRRVNPKCRILSVGSSEEYGNVRKSDLPLKETHILDPLNPYAVARVAQEQLSRVFVEAYDMNIVLTRSFNHIGPGQDQRFVVPSFINRILTIKNNGEKKGIIETGDVSIVRDFVDVRDVVRAYYLLLLNGRSGQVYNVCSGKAYGLIDLIEMISQEVGVKVETKINKELIRPTDNKVIVGSSKKIEEEIGWIPEIPMCVTIADMIRFMEEND